MPNVEPLRAGDPAAVGRYRLVGRLGAGGQGVVYLGQARNGAPVAIKVLREDMAGDDRFAKEIAAARRVEPFCIAQVLDASTSGRPYIVTEYVDGPSLQDAGRHSGAELQRLAVATATALAAIHQAGVVHRDFTPSNVLLGRDGPRVIDFGIARALVSGVTSTSSIVGTPAYMAPEQLAGQVVGAQADVFAWASVIVYAASGVPPFGDDSLPAVINRILHSEPQVGELPEPLRSVVLSCLAKDPARRPSMQDVLLRLLGGQSRPPTPPSGRTGYGAAPDQAAYDAAPDQAGYGAAPDQAAAYGTAPGQAAGRDGGPGAGRARRRGKTAAIAGASGISVLALAGAIVWLTPSTPQPKTKNLSGVSTSTPSPSTSPTRKPRPKKTDTSKPTTDPASQNGTSTADPATAAGQLKLRYVRVGGALNNGCYSGGQVTLTGLVQRQGKAVNFGFAWIIDSKTVWRSTAIIPEDGELYLTSPHNLKGTGGTHTATLRITSPVARQRSVSVTLCPRETY
ncbi:serine/threonine-protein kinase [Nonomuraea sp. NEAU-A123]|uniref:serine/threonine protein kinase n=1 Tax=Nonomuraea sp. NEAU-A123 TaxID=2839649 RepID=UPI001BE3E15E|nr:serine/threonine-protein kinase [Nonomuraea sp. NEAU-A123]MBT2232958.1 serine/threonine protein kinase [Nonomuraea sp. NEAU-A123]